MRAVQYRVNGKLVNTLAEASQSRDRQVVLTEIAEAKPKYDPKKVNAIRSGKTLY